GWGGWGGGGAAWSPGSGAASAPRPTLGRMTADPRPTLVVGAGQAAVSLVTELRALRDTAPVVVVGAEPEPPYERPPLSKGYLRGERDLDSLRLGDPDLLTGPGVTLVSGETVTAVHRDTHGGVAVTSADREIPFARLALVTGAREARLPVDGASREGVLTLRTVRDADRLAAALHALTRDGSREARLVVVGGGFVGLEVAASARALGAHVTVVEAADRVLSRSVTPLVSDAVARFHAGLGTTVLLGAPVERLHGTGGRAEAVVLADGHEISADLVVVGVGALPRTELAAAMGLRVEPRGIVVDARARTSDGVTVAAGDAAVGPNPYAAGVPGLRRLESVPHAIEQARVAAATLAGHETAYAGVPWFWSDQGELRLQLAGLPQGADATVVRGDPATGSFSVLSYREGRLLAIESLGTSADYLAVKRALERGMTVPAELAGDVTTPLKRLLRPVGNAPGS
ncbi:MAG: pyridine nucleotide-disulfide oxidoreductase, partial [Humibacillus sp.]|nr:pyridine nucleotide-disulfide oxidoreductase [Humibacillus sp.]